MNVNKILFLKYIGVGVNRTDGAMLSPVQHADHYIYAYGRAVIIQVYPRQLKL